jgi:hypothetical protein
MSPSLTKLLGGKLFLHYLRSKWFEAFELTDNRHVKARKSRIILMHAGAISDE